MKIYRRSWIQWVVIGFCFLTFLNYYGLYCLQSGLSALRLDHLLLFSHSYRIEMCVWFLGVFFIYYLRPSKGLFVFIFLMLFNLYLLLETIFKNQSKVVVVFLVLWAICFYYFYILFQKEIESAKYTPGFELSLIFRLPENIFEIEMISQNGQAFYGFLTNWSPDQCFIYIPNFKGKLRGRVTVKCHFHNNIFSWQGYVAVKTQEGVGLQVIVDQKNQRKKENSDLIFSEIFKQKEMSVSLFDWDSLYSIIENRGLRRMQFQKM
jgi:hypothetical protein